MLIISCVNRNLEKCNFKLVHFAITGVFLFQFKAGNEILLRVLDFIIGCASESSHHIIYEELISYWAESFKLHKKLTATLS